MMNYQQLWSTPIGKTEINLPKSMRDSLVQCVTSATNLDLFNYTKYASDSQIHIFKAVYRFEMIVSKLIREYVKEAWGLDENIGMLIHCLSHIQQPHRRRVEPHFHDNADGTLIYYLTVGNEYFIENEEMHYTSINNDYSGDLMLLDPRPNVSYPYNNKARTIRPVAGTTVIQPGYIWHETNSHTKSGLRISLVVNFDIAPGVLENTSIEPTRELMRNPTSDEAKPSRPMI